MTEGKIFGGIYRGGRQDVYRSQAGFLFTLDSRKVTCEQCLANLTGRMRA